MTHPGDLVDSLQAWYRSGENDIVRDFYVPCLKVADAYDRAAGYFTSNAFPVLAQGLEHFIARSGRMRLVTSPVLAQPDAEAISQGYAVRRGVVEAALIASIREAAEAFQSATATLAWMVAEGHLDIRVAIPRMNGIYHEKFGIFSRYGSDFVAFVGSPNETLGGVLSNFEQIAVFAEPFGAREVERIGNLRDAFSRLWNDETADLEVIEFPEAARRTLLEYRPPNRPAPVASSRDLSVDLFEHQRAAIAAWTSANFRGILEMATGTGKTITALAATRPMARDGSPIVILVPGLDLLDQWKTVIEQRLEGAGVVTCGGDGSWPSRLSAFLIRWRIQAAKASLTGLRDSHYILATMDTASTPRFQALIRKVGPRGVLIVDEAHRVGAVVRRRALGVPCEARLGLSATPERAWDSAGQEAIENGIGEVCFRYTLKDAIRDGYLTPYEYRPRLVALNLQERVAYDELSTKIMNVFNVLATKYPEAGGNLVAILELASPEEAGPLQTLLFQRADVLKEASAKLDLVRAIARDDKVTSCLIYCNDEDQVERVNHVLRAEKRRYGVFTSARLVEEQRRKVLRDFEEGRFDFLVSIRCLDEGIDIPGAVHALILASSRTEREFIQRRGRVLRVARNKSHSFIHDPVVIPVQLDDDDLPVSAITNAERAIITNELKRAELFADAAENSLEAMEFLYKVRNLVTK